MSVDWYDLLDVPRDADTDTIRAAWKAAVADLDPTDKTFRVYSQAAEVLLDPDRRAAYDASLAPEEPAEAEAPAPAAEPADPAKPAESEDSEPVEAAAPTWAGSSLPAGASGTYLTPAESPGGGRAGWKPPTWLLIGVALLAAIVFGFALWWSNQVPSDEEIEQETTSAQAAAEKAVVDALAYDFRDLQKSHDAAVAHMTKDYREDDYEPLFSVIEQNAAAVKPVVTVKVVGSAVVRTGDRTQVLVFFNRETTNKTTTKPRTSYDQATLTMENVDGTWLIDDIETA